MITKDFYVFADVPAINKQANKFLAALDLGIDGAFIKRLFVLTATHKEKSEAPDHEKENYEEPNFENVAKAIKNALESNGCININIYWEEDGAYYDLGNANVILMSD